MKTAPKFRGKRLDNMEKVVGDAITDCIFSRENDGSVWIFVSQKYNGEGWVQVDPSTVEQIGGDVVEENNRMRDALEGLLNRYVSLVESGDAGFWDAEQEEQVIKAREALKEK